MGKAEDPYYNRKPVPDDIIRDVGLSGLTPQEEFLNRERKYSVDGVDVRKFSNSRTGGLEPQDDPYYGRRRVSKAETEGVGDTGLNPDQEYENRERKFSVNGVDVRRFSNSRTGGLEPQADPYYGRKSVSSKLTKGIGETGNTPADDYAVRERKQSVVNFSSDPFQLLSGQGHRASVVDSNAVTAANAATERRRSSAVGIHAAAAAAQATHKSGYDGKHLAPIESKPEIPPVDNVSHDKDMITPSDRSGAEGSSSGLAGGTGVAGTSTTGPAAPDANGHTNFYDSVTVGHDHAGVDKHINTSAQQHYDDPDSVAPHETR